jgi:hypothetical protein
MSGAPGLPGRIDGLFRSQGEAWPLLAKGLAGLAQARTKLVRSAGSEVLVRHIPHRAASTNAAVDRESIGRRPCFLCRENLDPAEEGLSFGETHTIYCNPFPIVERHLTVVHREHRPQRIHTQIGTMLDLAGALPGYFVVYNGPECGASAPDHAHLQAGLLEGLPLVRGVAGRRGPAVEIYGLRLLLFRGRDRSRLEDEVSGALAILSAVTGKSPEPLCNLAVFDSGALPGRAPDPDARPPRRMDDPADGWTVVVFPRGKHRPDAFHSGELTVSPAAIDLSGILVAPLAGDFERITGKDVEAVFREVTLAEEPYREVAARLEGRR